MIRQAISCDICGRDKQQTNHWFVVYEHGAELRVSGWSSQARMSAKAKHLCGQTCLHKLVDEYMARTLAARVAPPVDESMVIEERSILAPMRADASCTSAAVHAACVRLAAPEVIPIDEFESSARLIDPADLVPEEALPPVAELSQRIDDKIESAVRVIMPILELHHELHDEKIVVPGRPGYNPRTWRGDAWKREQEREKRTRTGSRRRSLV